MDSSEKEMLLSMAENIGDLVESILRRQPPFDQIPFHPEVSYRYRKYYQYEPDLDQSFRKKVLEHEVAWARFNVRDRLVPYTQRFLDKHPEYKEVRNDFAAWVKSRESDAIADHTSLSNECLKKAIVNQTVKQVVKHRKPEFTPDNKAFGSLGFSKPWSFGNRLYLIVDTGTWRRSLSFSIGLHSPRFCFDIADFFGGVQSHYSQGYLSVEQVKEGVNRALDLIELVQPHFEKAVQKAFENAAL